MLFDGVWADRSNDGGLASSGRAAPRLWVLFREGPSGKVEPAIWSGGSDHRAFTVGL